MATHLPLILVIEDDEELSTLLVDLLSLEQYLGFRSRTLGDAFRHINPSDAEFIVLSSKLPDGRGLDWLKANRESLRACTLLLIDPDEEPPSAELRKELNIGAVLTRPFSLKVLLKRIQEMFVSFAIKAKMNPTITFHGLELNTSTKTLTYKGQPIEFTFSEFMIFWVLMSQPGKPVQKEYIYQRAFGRSKPPGDRSLDVHISAIRQKLRHVDGHFRIEGRRRVGYALLYDEIPQENTSKGVSQKS